MHKDCMVETHFPGNGVAAAQDARISVAINEICDLFGNDKHRMLDILLAVQDRFHWISPASMEAIAKATGLTRIAVEGVASFYSFLSLEPKGAITIRLCDDIVDRFSGLADVVKGFEDELGIAMGTTSADGRFSLEYTPCIGMCDQAPAAMINDIVVTRLTKQKARSIAQALMAGARPQDLIAAQFDALSPYERATMAVNNNIRHAGEVLLGPVPQDAGLGKAMALRPEQIIAAVEASGLRGCGGAGFTTGAKWRFAAAEADTRRFVFCNADEGEPGTFKDRVLLTERADLLIEGMTIAARAVGASEGLIYLRGEYAYLREHLESVLAERRARGVLGADIMGAGRIRFRHPRADGRRCLHLRRGRRADQLLRGSARRAEDPPAVSGQSRLSGPSDRREQRRDLLPCGPHSGSRVAVVSRHRHRGQPRHQAVQCVGRLPEPRDL